MPWKTQNKVKLSDDFFIGIKTVTSAFVIAAILVGTYFILPMFFPNVRVRYDDLIFAFVGLMLIVPSLFIKRSKQETKKKVISILIWFFIMLSVLLAYLSFK